MTKTSTAAKLTAIAETAAKLAELIERSETNVLVGGAAGLPVQKATGIVNGLRVQVRVNIGAEAWFIITGSDAKANPIGYTGTDANEALALLVA